jgi:hypothetical protein
MAQISLNMEGVDHQTSFEPLPAGVYVCQVTDSGAKFSKNNRPNLNITMTVVDGEFTGRKIFDNFTLDHEIGLKIFKTLCVVAGHPNPNFVRDSEELHGLYAKVRIAIKEDPGYAPKNVVKGYMAADGSPTVAPAAQQSRAAAPAAPAASAKPAARKPWEKAA